MDGVDVDVDVEMDGDADGKCEGECDVWKGNRRMAKQPDSERFIRAMS